MGRFGFTLISALGLGLSLGATRIDGATLAGLILLVFGLWGLVHVHD